jgi:hypothetical protein
MLKEILYMRSLNGPIKRTVLDIGIAIAFIGFIATIVKAISYAL